MAVQLRHETLRGVRAELDLRADAVAGPARGDACPHGGDDAREILAGTERPRRQVLIRAADHEEIGEIHARRFDVDEDLARLRHRIRHVGQRKVLERAVLADDQGSHCFSCGGTSCAPSIAFASPSAG
jgi:hypothetical protein